MRRRTAVIVATPWLILAGLLMPMTLMPEYGDPWFIPFTTLWFLAAMVVFYPATSVVAAMGQPILGIAHWLVLIGWAAIMSGVLWPILGGGLHSRPKP